MDHVVHLLISGHHPALYPHHRLAGCLCLRPTHAANNTTKCTTKGALVQRGGEYASHRVAGLISPLLHRLVNGSLGFAALPCLCSAFTDKAASSSASACGANLAQHAAHAATGTGQHPGEEVRRQRAGVRPRIGGRLLGNAVYRCAADIANTGTLHLAISQIPVRLLIDRVGVEFVIAKAIEEPASLLLCLLGPHP
ncbi:hypothetical protein CF113_11815 [Aeromonas veronii]|nr:hypothetical protein CF113_11815 [Aeromonas veronii]